MEQLLHWFLVTLALTVSGIAVGAESDSILIRNVRVFDGVSGDVSAETDVLISGNTIERIGNGLSIADGVVVINGAGRVLTPGLIDTHSHLSIVAAPTQLQGMHWDEIGAKMAKRAQATLMHGFTTVRDLGGPVFGLKKAVDEGAIAGPRIYPSGAFITQTSGHGDFRNPMDRHPRFTGDSSNMERLGYYRIVDGPDEVLAAVRENLRNGATQIKLMGSGGVGSIFDPIDSVQFTPEEIRAAVQAVSDWDTYAGSHLHNAPAMQRALENGVMSVDHGSMITEPVIKLLVEKDAFLNMHFAWSEVVFEAGFLTEFQLAKARTVVEGSKEGVRLAKKYKAKVTFCIDAFGDHALWEKVTVTEFTARRKHFSDLEVMQQATSNAAELLKLSGKRNPYPGELGVIREGALADLLIVDGNPLEDVSLFVDTANLRVIMKDGTVYKNTL